MCKTDTTVFFVNVKFIDSIQAFIQRPSSGGFYSAKNTVWWFYPHMNSSYVPYK